MADEHYGPRGDPARHRTLIDLEAGLDALAAADPDRGRVCLIVSRRADGVRETWERAELSPEGGMPGDRWGRRARPDPKGQLTVMRREVAELIANGQPLTLFGDNLIVDLDISEANLPVGSRLRVGQALVVVSPKPHDGCSKFKGRFGEDALRFVSAPPTRPQNLRGVYWTVIEPGPVAVGDPIQVLSRPG
jgi:MOSC domain-containing protein YiiM